MTSWQTCTWLIRIAQAPSFLQNRHSLNLSDGTCYCNEDSWRVKSGPNDTAEVVEC